MFEVDDFRKDVNMTSILAMVTALVLAVNGLFSVASVTAEKISKMPDIVHEVDDVEEAEVETEEKTGAIDYAHYYVCKDFGNISRGSTSMARTGALDLCYAMAIEKVTGITVDVHVLVSKYVHKDLLYTSLLLNDMNMKERAIDFTSKAVRKEVDAGNPVVVVFQTERGTMSPCVITGYDSKGISLWSPAYGKEMKLPYALDVSKRVMSARVLTSNSDK